MRRFAARMRGRFLAAGLFLGPIVGGREPRFQRLGVNVLFGALLVVVSGSLAGQYFAIHQALLNLLSNAIDAVGSTGGLIRVVCRYDAENRQSIIDVIDNGKGIAPSMMNHLFQLFHSTKGNRGTGLGLAVTKKIVEEHDGSISVKSVPGEGTTFTIRLPVKSTDPAMTYGPAR